MDSLRRWISSCLPFGQASTVSFIIIITMISSNSAIKRAPDLMGSYCGSRTQKCCQNRSDSCSVPVLGTLCYCDQFCKSTDNDDCCPDYDEVCGKLRERTEASISCSFKGAEYRTGQTFKDNCNECTCKEDGTICCDRALCVTDEHLLQLVGKLSPFLGWKPHNHSKFWGHTYSAALHGLANARRPNRHIRNGVKHAAYLASLSSKPKNLPIRFDVRRRWPTFIGGIDDQEWCDDAWAHVTADVASDRLAIQTRGSILERLSAEELMDCSHSGQKTCFTQGGHLDRAWHYMKAKGLHPEGCYQRTEKYKCAAPVRHCKRYRSSPMYAISGEENIQAEILLHGPVQATMRVYREFFSYGGGVYRRMEDDQENRVGFTVVRLLGWDVVRNTKYWIAANTWGTDWGKDGYFHILRGTNECGIEENVLASWGASVPTNYSTILLH